MYPISPYPVIAEFRAMLFKYSPETILQLWNGRNFFAYIAERDGAREYWFRAQDNGISFGFSEAEWQTIRTLFTKGWECPEVKRAWEQLGLEYGEL
jgi:hypothetical protein